jgi:hypothetical protein
MAIGQHQEIKPEAKDQKPARTTTGEVRLRVDKPAEPTLEDMLNKALKDNPDIKVAEAKVREAEAELNRTRLQVTQKVLTFHHTREAQKAAVKVAADEVARMRKLQETNSLPQGVLDQMEDRLAQAKAKLAEIEAEMPYLLGEQHLLTLSGNLSGQLLETASLRLLGTEFHALDGYGRRRLSVKGSSHLQTVPDTTLEKIRKALDTPVTLDYQQMSAAEILKDLEKKVPGISFHVLLSSLSPVDLHLDGTVPLGAALQLIEDMVTDYSGEPAVSKRCAFAIRDYGILFTAADRIPPGAIQLDDLLKERAFAERLKKEPEDKKPTGDKSKPAVP